MSGIDIVAIPANVYLDPIMDTAILNGPLWFWLLVGLAVILILSNFYWLWTRMKMISVLEYVDAVKQNKSQTIYIGKDKVLKIMCLDYMDAVFSRKNIEDESKWLLSSPDSTFRLGGVRTTLVRDNFDYTLDPIAEIAICKLAHDWSIKNPDAVIKNYSDFVELRDGGWLLTEYPDGVRIPLYNIYDPALIQKYLPSGRSSGTFGSILTRMAKDIRSAKETQKWYEKWIPAGVAITIGLIMLMFSYMYSQGAF